MDHGNSVVQACFKSVLLRLWSLCCLSDATGIDLHRNALSDAPSLTLVPEVAGAFLLPHSVRCFFLQMENRSLMTGARVSCGSGRWEKQIQV